MKTEIALGVVIGAGLIATAYYLAGPWFGSFLAAGLAWEGWTLVNKRPKDTISEVIRRWSRMQLMLPWLFGAVTGISLGTGYLHDPYLIAALLFLQGHWFFTLREDP